MDVEKTERETRRIWLEIIFWDVPCVLILGASTFWFLWFMFHGEWSKCTAMLCLNFVTGYIDSQIKKYRGRETDGR